MTTNDQIFMLQAMEEAKKAFIKGEVPIGAVAVIEGKIIARAHNEVEGRQDASCHAELLCLQRAAAILGGWRLIGVTLYSTIEPCVMCCGAATLFRVKKVVYGAADSRHGGHQSVCAILGAPHPIHQVEVTCGLFAEEAKELMQSFFRERRKK